MPIITCASWRDAAHPPPPKVDRCGDHYLSQLPNPLSRRRDSIDEARRAHPTLRRLRPQLALPAGPAQDRPARDGEGRPAAPRTDARGADTPRTTDAGRRAVRRTAARRAHAARTPR